MQSVWRILKDIFFPQVCVSCGKKIESGLWCSPCEKKLRDVRLLDAAGYDCPDLEGVLLLFRYEGAVRRVLQGAKFNGRRGFVACMAEEVQLLEREGLIAGFPMFSQATTVVPVPTDPERARHRGYELPSGIFHDWALAKHFCWRSALSRVRHTKPQYGLRRHERRANVKDCFRVTGEVGTANVLLVDDIFTSGATMEEAAQTLRAGGVKHVWALAFAGGGDS